jgi:Sec-independent protein translocase protein TatA
MDLFGIGGAELLMLLFLGGVLLGPRRLAKLARDIGGFMNQVRAVTRNLSTELERELNLLEATERQAHAAPKPGGQEGGQPGPGTEDAEPEPPEAYRRFREDFPAEGDVESLAGAGGAARGNGRPGQSGQPAKTQSPTRAGAAGSGEKPSGD